VSRKNNVNPDYYKLAGRDRPNEDVSPSAHNAQADAPPRGRKKGDGPPPNLIPGAPPVGEKPAAEDEQEKGD
jgi:hypothetical protein